MSVMPVKPGLSTPVENHRSISLFFRLLRGDLQPDASTRRKSMRKQPILLTWKISRMKLEKKDQKGLIFLFI
jgi:hypothetical protein